MGAFGEWALGCCVCNGKFRPRISILLRTKNDNYSGLRLVTITIIIIIILLITSILESFGIFEIFPYYLLLILILFRIFFLFLNLVFVLLKTPTGKFSFVKLFLMSNTMRHHNFHLIFNALRIDGQTDWAILHDNRRINNYQRNLISNSIKHRPNFSSVLIEFGFC